MLIRRTVRRMFCSNTPADAFDACENIVGDLRVVAPYDFTRRFFANVCLVAFGTLLCVLASPSAAAESNSTSIPILYSFTDHTIAGSTDLLQSSLPTRESKPGRRTKNLLSVPPVANASSHPETKTVETTSLTGMI